MRVKGRTCYQAGATKDARVQQNKDKVEIRILSHQSIKKEKKRTQQKSQILTYLLSFFSGGDFLSQPWKRISPPLMSAARFCCLLRWNRSSVTGTWRLLEAGPFKELSAFGPHCRSLLPPLDQNQSSAERWCCRTHTPATSVRNDSSQKLPNWGEKGGGGKYKTRPACGAHIEIRSNRGEKLSWCGARKYRRVSAVCFPTHTTPTEQREGWAALGWTGWENRLHCSKVLRQAAFWAKFENKCFCLYNMCAVTLDY